MRLGHWQSMSMVQKYTESVSFEDSQKHYIAPTDGMADATRGLRKVTRGLEEANVVPRNRIELLTRGFSVRCSTY